VPTTRRALSSIWRVSTRVFLGGLIGMFVGFWVGVLLVFVTKEDCIPPGGAGCLESGQYVPLAFTAFGLVVGVVLGVGLLVFNRWRRVPPESTASRDRRA
jgi:ABC-type methionine transport system permease subunit